MYPRIFISINQTQIHSLVGRGSSHEFREALERLNPEK